jgi:hypothetical protein
LPSSRPAGVAEQTCTAVVNDALKPVPLPLRASSKLVATLKPNVVL